ncbi:phage holin family protein [Pendulispora albinea]|uniref:Phage holin family protein n=1 Tax=Pendulispora albinea TaxID=2741071 RepID=A0ABZ2LX27_9BACT
MDMPTKSEPTIGALLGSLASETGTLVRQEIRLASAEMGQTAKSATSHLGLLGVGGVLALAGLLTVIAGLILRLQPLVPMWISAMVIGIIAGGSGFLVVRRGMKALRGLDFVPQRTIQTLKQDATWMKEQLR